MRLLFILILPIYLLALSADFDTLSADFTQTVTNEHKKEIVYSGDLSIKKPDKAIWRYSKPIKKDVYIYGTLVIVYEPELAQAVYMTKKNLPNINSLLKNAVVVGENRYKAKNDGRDIFFDMKDGVPHSITYHDDMDNAVEIKLSNQKKNIPVSNSAFEFVAPTGTDIIKQ
jgi:outer membrane lipoprotein carrier protein